MKSNLIKGMLTVTLFTGIFCLSAKADWECENLRIAYGVASEDTIITEDGNVWEYTCNSLQGNVRVTFNTCGTKDVTDDIIINVE